MVDDKVVDKYFDKVDDPDWEDLKLPARPNSTTTYVSKL